MSFTPLPEELPDDPLPLLDQWLRDAIASQGPEHRNPTAMTLATCDPDGTPDARVVLCRGFDAVHGSLTFFTDRSSTKGRQLRGNPKAAVVFYWEDLYRQVRAAGPVVWASDQISDAYFASRALGAQASASVSQQSQPLADRSELERLQVERVRELEGGQPPRRPERWGGLVLWIERLEFWAGRVDRLHDRVRYVRRLERRGDGFKGSGWSAGRLQP